MRGVAAEIKHLGLNDALLAKFNYAYQPGGNISSWRMEGSGLSVTPRAYDFRYDAIGQLSRATVKDATTADVIRAHVYGYDKGRS